ncbi:MAG: hypothetical protein QW332_05800 [Thermoproteota archaeon]
MNQILRVTGKDRMALNVFSFGHYNVSRNIFLCNSIYRSSIDVVRYDSGVLIWLYFKDKAMGEI